MDGLLYFYEPKDERREIIVQVKGRSGECGDVACLRAEYAQATSLGGVNNQKRAWRDSLPRFNYAFTRK